MLIYVNKGRRGTVDSALAMLDIVSLLSPVRVRRTALPLEIGLAMMCEQVLGLEGTLHVNTQS